ncbi:efflux transporter outer membrane subunit [Paucibacter sp. R3-3]|uniref:Efflux transporter outer membrane subunit n=1 Tax=Roseateles agri TaxID=3098619 RepID=A0ABU5DPR1_9BURK|nr:efflux transporter outer membrane subunit [Paucibacter sp. R3-3]MDY0747706.1 efflux transporter outer membrane subunit [Paucibacter sp. R3-3]
MATERTRVAVLLLAILAGCKAVGPDFHPPVTQPPTAWPAEATARRGGDVISGVDTGAAFDPQWWTIFGDPVLDRLVRDAAAQNLDIRTAELRIEAARAQTRSAEAARWPSGSGMGLAGRSRASPNGPLGALSGGGQQQQPDPQQQQQGSLVSDLYQVGFDASWELDLWGGVRRSVEAAKADRESAELAKRDALVSLSAEIARTYFSLRGTERALAIAEAQLQTEQHLQRLVSSRREAGFAPQSDVAAQSAQVQAALAQLPPLRQQAAQSRNRLALLLALPPGALAQRLDAQNRAALPALPASVPAGLPDELLRRRADVRKTEADLHAATARIGVATAKLYPGITLGLAGGLQASHFSELGDWASRFLLGGAEISVPIFQGGKLKAQVRLADLQSQQALLAWRKTVLTAFGEVDDAIDAYAEAQRHAAALGRQWQEARHGRDLSRERWEKGLSSFIEVLDAERSAEQVESQLAQARVATVVDLVALYKALGGGWEPTPDPSHPTDVSARVSDRLQ